MKATWRLIIVLLNVALILSGCGGGGGSSRSAAAPDGATATTLTTTLAFGDAPQVAPAAVRPLAVQTVTVTLTLPDGTTYTMVDNGSGGYSATVKNFPTGSPFVIEAHAGDLVLKNFFDRLPGEGESVDLGTTDPKTTLFVDVLATLAGALDANQNFPSAAQLLQKVQGATLEVDVVTLKDMVTDDNDPVFAQVRQSYQTVLTEDNFRAGTAPGGLVSAGSLKTMVEEFRAGGVLPAAGSDIEAAQSVVTNYFKAFLAGDTATMAASLGSDGFLWEGMDAAQFLAAEQADDEFGTLSATNLSSNRLSVFPGPEANSWWVYFGGEMTYTKDGLQRKELWDDRKDLAGVPILVKKDGAGRFALFGDQKKAEADFSLMYVFEENQRTCLDVSSCPENSWIGLEAVVEETTHYPVEGAQLSGSALSGSFSLNYLSWEDSNELHLWKQYKYNNSRTRDFAGTLEGSSLTLDIAFADGSEEQRTVTVTQTVAPVYPKVTALTPQADGSLVVQWTDLSSSIPGGEIANIDVEIIDDRSGWFYILQLEDLPPGTTSATVPKGVLVPGQIYLARISYGDLYGRDFMTHRYFEAQAPFFPITDALLDGKSFQMTWDDLATEGERGVETYTFTKSGTQYTFTYVEKVYNASDALIATYTESFTGSIQADGTFRYDYPQADPENGATYGIMRLLEDAAGSVTFRYVDYTPAGVEVDNEIEVWTKL